jgi:hypothetical protein
MKKIKRVGFTLLAAVALMGFAGCKGNTETDHSGHDHPAKEGVKTEHPAKEGAKAEHPEHPTKDAAAKTVQPAKGAKN